MKTSRTKDVKSTCMCSYKYLFALVEDIAGKSVDARLLLPFWQVSQNYSVLPHKCDAAINVHHGAALPDAYQVKRGRGILVGKQDRHVVMAL